MESHDDLGTDRGPIRRMALWFEAPFGGVFRWVVAATIFALALGARLAISPYLPAGTGYPMILPVVIITGLIAGLWPAIAVAAASWASFWYFFLPPLGSFGIGIPEAWSLVLFAASSLAEVLLVQTVRSALHRLASAEAEAQRLAQQRSLMFSELQHRVSNNLSVLSSLVSFERRRTSDPVARRALDATAARLELVSQLNRLLQNPSTQDVDFGVVLQALAPRLLASHGADQRISVHLSVESVAVPAIKAVPLSLIAAELLSNAIEHGFPGDQEGRITVALEPIGRHSVRLLVRDDGVGLPRGFQLTNVESLGMTIVKRFAEDLDAHLIVTQDRGAVACLTFELRDRSPKATGSRALQSRQSARGGGCDVPQEQRANSLSRSGAALENA